MSVANVPLRQLLEAGVHFGHHTRRWNPKMSPYLFGVRSGIHIINLQKTAPLLHKGLTALQGVVSNGGRVLFVATKHQASTVVRDAAIRCGQYYVNHRWLGGTLTNWGTISQSIKHLKNLKDELESGAAHRLTKKERLLLEREYTKLETTLGGIKDMGGVPDILFVIDTNKEHLAVAEARKLNIPVVAILDSNSNPDGITYPIPGNDDALQLYCSLASDAVLDGLRAELTAQGIDVGAAGAGRTAVPPAIAREDAVLIGETTDAESPVSASVAEATQE